MIYYLLIINYGVIDMDLFLNFSFAWIAVIFTILSSIIFIFRKVIIKYKLKGTVINTLNKYLRKYHKHIGITVVLTGLIHGLFSSEDVFSINLGTIAWIISILLGVNWSVRKYLSKYKSWMYYHRIITVIFIFTIGLHIYDVGGVQVFNVLFQTEESNNKVDVDNYVSNSNSNSNLNSDSEQSNITVPNEEVEEISNTLMGGNYKDGTYTGEATAYRDGLVVQIEIKDNTLLSIEIINHNEVNSRFYQKAFNTIPQKIIESQSTDVDATSGASFSSIGIMNAVNNALSKAIISGDLPTDKALPQNSGHGRH